MTKTHATPDQTSDTPALLPVSAQDLLARLDEMGLNYVLHEHRPVFTVEESADLKAAIPGLHCRNLFVRDKKGTMFLITAANETAVDLKALPEILECKRLSFGSADRLWRTLGVRPGSVCPFAVINDKEGLVTLILDKAMLDADIVCVHPMENHMTVGIAPQDLIAFAKKTGHPPLMIDFETLRIETL